MVPCWLTFNAGIQAEVVQGEIGGTRHRGHCRTSIRSNCIAVLVYGPSVIMRSPTRIAKLPFRELKNGVQKL